MQTMSEDFNELSLTFKPLNEDSTQECECLSVAEEETCERWRGEQGQKKGTCTFAWRRDATESVGKFALSSPGV